MTFLTQPDERRDKGKKAQVTTVEFVKTGENTPEPLDFVEKAFDQMALFVQMLVVVTGLGAILAGRNDRNGTHISNQLNEVIVVKGFVGNDIVTAMTLEQSRSLGDVMALSPGEYEVERVSECINDDMKLGAKATSAPT